MATVRHEVWQYSYRYGAWSKEKSTKALDRILLRRDEFRRWTWVWEPRLGGIEIPQSKTVRLSFELPSRFDPTIHRGWFPN